jgi:hypothetical protein
MALMEDLVSLITQAPAVFVANDVKRSTSDTIPDGPGPYAVVILTGGTGPLYVQNNASPNLHRPGAQIKVHSSNFKTAYDKAIQLYNRFTAVRNQDINGVRYVRIVPLQEPFDGGLDNKGRAQVIFNVLITKR